MSESTNNAKRLNAILFEELERLNGIDAADEKALKAEIGRSNAIQGVAREVNGNHKNMLDAAKYRAEWAGAKVARMPKELEE